MRKRRVILITDGDEFAGRTIQYIAKEIGGRCISRSQGNPTPMTGDKLVELILQSPKDPVFVMFDDSGAIGEGVGEQAMKHVANHPQIEVLGVIAVASRTKHHEWTRVDISVDRDGQLTEHGVDKDGVQEMETGRINGDTVYCLDQLNVPIIVGIGDIGKMDYKDHVKNGSPITRRAVEIILERSKFNGNNRNESQSHFE